MRCANKTVDHSKYFEIDENYKEYDLCYACIEDIKFYLELCFTYRTQKVALDRVKVDIHENIDNIILFKETVDEASLTKSDKLFNNDITTMKINEHYDYILKNRLYDLENLHESICCNVAKSIVAEYKLGPITAENMQSIIKKCTCNIDTLILQGCTCGSYRRNEL